MTDHSLLDLAYMAMESEPTNDVARLGFYERVADAELFVLVSKETIGQSLTPTLFGAEDGQFCLAFDRQERLAEFVGQTADYSSMSGRALVGMLADRGIGVAINPDVAPSSTVIDADQINWLAELLNSAPETRSVAPISITAPVLAAKALVVTLQTKLAAATGMAKGAHLVAAQYADGYGGLLLVFVDVREGAEAALSQAVHEAVKFSGQESAIVDVTFVSSDCAMVRQLISVGQTLVIPDVTPDRTVPAPPGMDKARPPKLR